ncbi:hypothetical protein FOMPIDRAFT_50104 [Fomitopsis schrenkii]|uniref:lytic cellulose monooxygenase (C4-dehydrogenating) n=1 Tax=Fomitopsis schrenkii TaxID=2126942 RepID=S8EBE2_FOMSC|nr:hypothetical protein FOMPIDRAFT_50104 [Fomitopsis schrenkii]
MALTFSTLLLVSCLAVRAHAHGYVSNVTVDGAMYPGNAPGRNTVYSPIRTVATDGPVTNVSDIDLACGVGALVAPMDAPAYPGSTLNFTWVSGSGGNWPHEVGPVLTYMASCGNATTCVGFNASGAEWFKIAEDARQSGNAFWVQQLIMEGDNYNVTIPAGLAPGAYLLRNELIGLQNAMAPGGAEFFPSCTQLRILGNGTEVPAPNSTVSFPGAYNDTDPGILFDAYTNPDTPYVIPGPPLAMFVNMTDATNIITSQPVSSTQLMSSAVPSPSSTSAPPSVASVPPSASSIASHAPQYQQPTASVSPSPSTASLSTQPSATPSPANQGEMPIMAPGPALVHYPAGQLLIPMVDAMPLEPVRLERRVQRRHSRIMRRQVHH